MKLLMINYADRGFKRSQRRNTETAKRHGIEDVIQYGYNHLPEDFRQKYADILALKRGAGYWLWKSKIIEMALAQVNTGDIVFYCDSGCHIIKSIQPLIDICQEEEVVLFEVPPFGTTTPHYERIWTKRDVFVAMNADIPEIHNSIQLMSGFQLYKKGEKALELVNEYLKWSCHGRLLTDEPNVLGKPNLDGFKENRHDQSILSVAAKKMGVKGHRDPTKFGDNFKNNYPNDTYEQLIDLHRKSK